MFKKLIPTLTLIPLVIAFPARANAPLALTEVVAAVTGYPVAIHIMPP